jgi:hypothetical protein
MRIHAPTAPVSRTLIMATGRSLAIGSTILLSFLIGLHQVLREPTRTQYDHLIPLLRSAATDPDAYLGMGSLPNFPLLHHTVIGLEALEQMEMAGYWSDIIIGCVGGG